LAATRYRERHHVAGATSDPGDAKMLADLAHRSPQPPGRRGRQFAGRSREATRALTRTPSGVVSARSTLCARVRRTTFPEPLRPSAPISPASTRRRYWGSRPRQRWLARCRAPRS
jgi:hypothetical protein